MINRRKKFNLNVTVILLFLLASACASHAPPIHTDPALNPGNSAKLHFYRPVISGFFGQAIDYRVMVDGNYYGSLDGGSRIEAIVKPGKNKIAINTSFREEGGEALSFNWDLEAGKDYYVRFSQHLDGLQWGYYVTRVTGHGELRLVSKEDWQKRR